MTWDVCKRVLQAAGAAAGVLCVIAAGAPASATAACGSPHCYGIADWDVSSGGFQGAQVNLRSSCLSVVDKRHEFVDNEVWVEFSHGKYWTEAGLTDGNPVGRKAFFWAGNRKDIGYHQHFSSSKPVADQTYTFTIKHSSGTNHWNISGPFPATSTQPGMAKADRLQTGTETTTGNVSASGSSSYLGYYNVSYDARAGWPGATLFNPSGIGFAAWIDRPNSVRTGAGNC